MAWSTPPTRTTGHLITAANWNEIVDDLRYLKGLDGDVELEDDLGIGTGTPRSVESWTLGGRALQVREAGNDAYLVASGVSQAILLLNARGAVANERILGVIAAGGELFVNKFTDAGAGMILARIYNAGNVVFPLTAAFLGIKTSNQTVSASSTATITFAERFDQGLGHYAGNTTFTAPVTGRYRLGVAVVIGGGSGGAATVRLVTSNRTYVIGRRELISGQAQLIASSLLVDMDGGDTAYVQVSNSHTSALTIHGDTTYGESSYSGELAC